MNIKPSFSKHRHITSLGVGLSIALGLAAPVDATVNVIELTARDVQIGLAAGEFTSVDLVQGFFNQINTFDSFYKAFISLNPNALETAAALDLEYATSGPRGPLHGVPVAIKDNMDWAGFVTTNGYAGFSSATGGVDLVPGTSASVVRRLEEAGAIILGKTNLPDFALDGVRSNSSVLGQTLNPSNLDLAPGGSSGGTATAVNASMAVLGLGTETGRSIHNPSSFQGLVGIRPTQGLVPIDGIYPLNGTFRDVAGPMARTVYDAAVTLDVLAGPDSRDRLSYASLIPPGGYTTKLSPDALNGARIGYFDNAFNGFDRVLDAPTQALYDTAMGVIEGLGATIVTDKYLTDSDWRTWIRSANAAVDPGLQPSVQSPWRYDEHQYLQALGPDAAFNSIEEFNALVGPEFARPLPTENDLIDPFVRPANQDWIAWRAQIRGLFHGILDEYELDALVFPVSADPPPPLNAPPANNTPLVQGVINLLGVPGVIVNAGYYEDGTPFGVIVIGRLWDEANLLGFAYAYEQATLLRTPPILIPEPASIGVLMLGGGLLLRRRRC